MMILFKSIIGDDSFIDDTFEQFPPEQCLCCSWAIYTCVTHLASFAAMSDYRDSLEVQIGASYETKRIDTHMHDA